MAKEIKDKPKVKVIIMACKPLGLASNENLSDIVMMTDCSWLAMAMDDVSGVVTYYKTIPSFLVMPFDQSCGEVVKMPQRLVTDELIENAKTPGVPFMRVSDGKGESVSIAAGYLAFVGRSYFIREEYDAEFRAQPVDGKDVWFIGVLRVDDKTITKSFKPFRETVDECLADLKTALAGSNPEGT